MKILHTVEHYSPSVGGAQEVVKQLSEHMVLLGHEVTVATSKHNDRNEDTINGVKVVGFDVSGSMVQGFKGKDISKYQQFLLEGRYDVIMNYAAQQWTTDLMLPILQEIKAKKFLVPCGYSGLYNEIFSEYYQNLPHFLRLYDSTIYLSQTYRDIEFAKKHGLKNIIVIPNGADEREFSILHTTKAHKFREKYGIRAEEKLLLSIGNHTGMKGHKELINIFKKVQLKNTVLMIVGHIDDSGCAASCRTSAQFYNKILSKLNRDNKRIIMIDLPREETIAAYTASDLFVFFSNIECSPLVLFEAAAAGLPFVTSDAGNAIEVSEWTKAGIVVSARSLGQGIKSVDQEEAVTAIEKIVTNKSLRNLYAKNGRAQWHKYYTWEKIAKAYINVYRGKR